MFVFFIGPSST